MKTKALSLFVTVTGFFALLSGSIAIPILFRPFYYAHIIPLKLDKISGLDYSAVKNAYNRVLDYCMGLSETFSAGELGFSKDGAAHFKDVRGLFILDLLVFAVSVAALICVYIIVKKKGITLPGFKGHTPLFFSAVVLILTVVIIAILVATDFSAAFEIFHKIFFPGKTNWTFNPYLDPVILILPEVFFRNCAIFIFANLIISCVAITVYDIIKIKKNG